jgi:hypothetical protein
MDILTDKMFAIAACAALVAAPMIMWLALYLAAKTSSTELRSVLPWIKMARWIAWGCGLGLVLFALIGKHLDHFLAYAASVGAFSAGLGISESWAKRKFAVGP